MLSVEGSKRWSHQFGLGLRGGGAGVDDAGPVRGKTERGKTVRGKKLGLPTT